jgi:hypothetical protein
LPSTRNQCQAHAAAAAAAATTKQGSRCLLCGQSFVMFRLQIHQQ